MEINDELVKHSQSKTNGHGMYTVFVQQVKIRFEYDELAITQPNQVGFCLRVQIARSSQNFTRKFVTLSFISDQKILYIGL